MPGSPAVSAGQSRPIERVSVQAEPDACSCGVGGKVEGGHVERVHREDVSVRFVSLGRTGAAVPRRSKVGAAFYRRADAWHTIRPEERMYGPAARA